MAFFFIESLGELYRDIQLQEIFPDSKFFVDCIPRNDIAVITKAYEQEKNQPGFNLQQFISNWFILPAAADTAYQSGNKPIVVHLHELWNNLERAPDQVKGTLIPLPFPYIVPGGRFREVYYWDSYFTMLGLQVSKRIDLIQNMVDNFAYLLNEIGFIPNGNRSYYLGRSQPPFFTLMVELLSEEQGEGVLLKYLPQVEHEYRFWMDGENHLSTTNNQFRRVVLLPDGSILNRYWDDNDTPRPEAYAEDIHMAKKSGNSEQDVYRHIRAAAESGWDFSSRWFKDGEHMETIQTTDIIPVDLNCLLLHTEEVLLKIYTIKKETALIHSFTERIQKRKAAIQNYCWNEAKGFYFDYQYRENNQTGCYTLAAVYSLFFSVAGTAQAQKVAKTISDEFLQPGGVVTTPYKSGQQWDAPNGWAPLQWMTYKGLKNYGHASLASQIRHNWTAINESVYNSSGKMMEKYNVADITTDAGGGEYPNQDGFGWTNGVYLALISEA